MLRFLHRHRDVTPPDPFEEDEEDDTPRAIDRSISPSRLRPLNRVRSPTRYEDARFLEMQESRMGNLWFNFFAHLITYNTMKIDRGRLKKGTSEVPMECQALIEKLRTCTREELLEELKGIDAWTYGKCELYHWIDVLDIFDTILEDGAKRVASNNWMLSCDQPENAQDKELLLWVLHFTTLLIEHSFSRHLYNSMEHLITLLASCDMNVVLAVLNLLYMFSKRSNFLTRMVSEKRIGLTRRLTYLAESWGGQESGFSLSECCVNMPMSKYPPGSSTLHYEYYAEVPESSQTISGRTKSYSNLLTIMHIENLDKLNKSPAEIMHDIVERYPPPKDKQVLMMLFTHIRLAVNFPNYPVRLLCVQARLQALSVLAYSNALGDNAHTLLYSGLLEELVEVVENADPNLVEIRAAALRALTSIIHLDRNPHFPKKSGSRLNMIIDVTGASSYHGFLPTLVRSCINTLTSPDSDIGSRNCLFPLPLATALFSFLYHLASYESGGEALVSCGMMESLLRVINWPGREVEHITFVTRAVRVIDLITNIEMQCFQTHGGLQSFISRLEMELKICRTEQPFEILPLHVMMKQQAGSREDPEGPHSSSYMPMSNEEPEVITLDDDDDDEETAVEEHPQGPAGDDDSVQPPSDMDVDNVNGAQSNGIDIRTSRANFDEIRHKKLDLYAASRNGKSCLPQRAALLKSMLNFLKKAIQDSNFSDLIRHIMEGSLPNSLRHIISNAEYYGASLFLLATDVVTVYVFQEPSLLSPLQDTGLTDVILDALLVKQVPATREVLGSLPNVFSALCLNDRGLAAFIASAPFDTLFKVLLSPVYLAAMRRRRSSDPLGDTASNLGNAMDELMRHQPTLKSVATEAIIKLLDELVEMGTDPRFVCWRAQSKMDLNPTPAPRPAVNNDGGSSDEEEEDEEEASTSSHPQRDETAAEAANSNERQPIALVEYIMNVMKFIDAILSNNSTDDHCREFVAQNGLPPLISILGLPNLPTESPVIPAAQSVATVCKSILNLSHEPQVLKIGLVQLSALLDALKPLNYPIEEPGSSILLHELASAPNLETAFSTASVTPLLHALSSAHGYVIMFVHVCRTGQTEIRSLSLSHWASELGISVLKSLTKLYSSLVWESTLLLALCSDDIIPPDSQFAKEDLDRLFPVDGKGDGDSPWHGASSDMNSNGMTSAMEALSTNDMEMNAEGAEGSHEGRQVPSAIQIKYIKPLLGASSRLGRALAELFGLLVKLCVGSPVRQRRGQQLTSTPIFPTPAAKAVAGTLTDLLVDGLYWRSIPRTPITKFKLTYLICSVGFTSPMLCDEKKYPYHLMLQKFVQKLGFLAFFDTFHWALTAGLKLEPEEGLEHPDLPEGTGEVLDAWLMLLDKMVNPKNVLESPHNITVKHGIVGKSFDPLKYLLDIHKSAFDAVMLMWGKKPLKHYGQRMTETILSILKHLLRGEKIMMERLCKEKDSTAAEGAEAPSTSTAAQPPPEHGAGGDADVASGSGRRRVDLDAPEPEVNQELLGQLMDMGFSRDHCVEALAHTSTVEQATEFLLSNPSPNRQSQNMSMDYDLAEEDQMLRAIAMSLGEKMLSDCDHPKEPVKPNKAKEDYEILLSRKAEIDKFTDGALQVCLQLMDTLPETVYRITDLIIAITKRNGQAWTTRMLEQLMNEIGIEVQTLLNSFRSKRPVNQVIPEVIESETALRAASRIHLFTLLFEPSLQGPVSQEMRLTCALVVERAGAVEPFVELLIHAEQVLTTYGEPVTPKWLAPLLLLLDLVEKVSVITHRKYEMLQVTNNVWRWFDLTSGKWTPYSVANNKIINDAYWNGESAVRINCGRRRYVIHFNYMIQANEESGSRRPVTMSLGCREKTEGRDYPPKSDKKDDKDTDKMDIDMEYRERRQCTKTCTFDGDDADTVVRCCIAFLALPVNIDSLHAAMRMCLRLSRTYDNAKLFVKAGGVRVLLSLTQASSFTGFTNLATLLIRHAVEEPVTLRLAMEKVIRSRTLPNIPPPYKEILYLMRNTSSCVCRDPQAYLEVAQDILRVDLNLLPRRSEGDEDSRLLVKAQQSRFNVSLMMQEEAAVQVIIEMLDFLAQPVYCEVNPEPPKEEEKVAAPPPRRILTTHSVPPVIHNTLMHRHPGDPLHPDAIEQREQESLNTTKKDDRSNNIPPEQDKLKRPLLPKSSILKILAEAVKSYTACARLITDHNYEAGQSDLVTEDCTALAFLLDKLLPINENHYDHECQTTSRMLIAALASCNHCPEAQTTLVVEVKAAFLRSLAMPESTEKHSHIQHLATVISSMIDNCPPLINQPPVPPIKLHQYNNNINNIVKVMLRKGMLIDLARVPHYLDLSSPNIANTMNAVLKPLETLSRIVNQPSTATPAKAGKPKPQTATTTGSADHTGTTTSEATHAQGEEAVEDTENTEHDISGTAESLEPTSESQVQGTVDDNALDDVMDQLLERSGESVSDDNILGTGFTVESEQSNRMETDDVHTPPIRNQPALPYANEEDDTQDVDRVASSDSESGTNASDDPDEEVNNVDDEDEDDDDEEEEEGDDNEDEEEPGSAYEEDGVDFFETEEALFRIPAVDRDSEDILMIQYTDSEMQNGPGPHIPWNSNSFPIPLGLFEDPTSAADVNGFNPLTPNHPLLMARNPDSNNLGGPRAQRGNRPRRYQYLQLNGRNPNPPVILQRLLGPGNHDLSITTNQTGYRDATRVVVMDNGMGLFAAASANSEEEQIDFVDQSGYLFGPSLTATLSNIPTALWWWCEEGKLLDGDSQPDCVLATASKVIEVLERAKLEELAVRREKMKKKMEEEEQKRKKEDKEKKRSREGDSDTTSTSHVPVRSNSVNEAPSNADVASATESLAESIVESVLRPSLPSHPPPGLGSGVGPDFAELTTGLLSSLSEILPTVAPQQNALQRFSDNESLHSETYMSNSMGLGSLSASSSHGLPSAPTTMLSFHSASERADTEQTQQAGSQNASNVVMALNDAGDASTPRVPDSNVLETSEDYNCLEEIYDENNPPPLIPLEDITDDNPDDMSLEEETESEREFRQNFRSTFMHVQRGESSNPFADGQPVTRPNAASGASREVAHDNENPTWNNTASNEVQPATNNDQIAVYQPSASTEQQPVQSGSGAEGGSELPEGVDPSFLAALPDEMREEVIAEQLRLQRLRQRAIQQSGDAAPANMTEVNPEFLAALPPAIQEEVLAQQRMEQQRQAAAAANPNDPVDAAAFFQNLQPSLRQAILTDMEDSQISVLPPDLAQEAQNLRREWEARNRQLMQERFFSHVSHGNSALSSILRNTGRVGATRYAIHTVPQRAQWSPWNTRPDTHPAMSLATHGLRLRGRQLLDNEALACLLIMLFVDEPKMNTGRLHRVLRNLCYHGPTREWVIKALLSIMERCNDSRPDEAPAQRPRRMSTRSQAVQPVPSTSATPSWLNISMDAALGLRSNVFNIVRQTGKRGSRSQETSSISIHAQAAPTVFRHTLEVLISLAKSFPGYFLPLRNKETDKDQNRDQRLRASTSSSTSNSRSGRAEQTNFWDILLKLDTLSTSKKGKSVARSHCLPGPVCEEEFHAHNFETSPFGQMITLLSSPVVKRSCMLTDKILRLLSLISIGLPEINPYLRRREHAEGKKPEDRDESVPVAEQHLRLAIEVLTSKSCSEEGLEDATALLLNLSNCPDPTKDFILRLLLDGAMELANSVSKCIYALMKELKEMNKQLRKEDNEEANVMERPNKGVVPDRFTNDSVVVVAPSKVKTGYDLQLPSMAPLTSKTSSQAFFLRILKVIVQIRESVRMSHRRRHDNGDSLDYLQGDSSADEQASGTEDTPSGAAMDTSGPASGAISGLASGATSGPATVPNSTAFPERRELSESRESQETRDSQESQDGSHESESAETMDTMVNKTKEEEPVLPSLSEQLPLDHLWETLSACLLELAETPDHHAVLVLQPAVEAFFLVHSTAAEEQRVAYDSRIHPFVRARDVAGGTAMAAAAAAAAAGAAAAAVAAAVSANAAPAGPAVPMPAVPAVMAIPVVTSAGTATAPVPMQNISAGQPALLSVAAATPPGPVAGTSTNPAPTTNNVPDVAVIQPNIAPVSPLQPDADASAANAQTNSPFLNLNWEPSASPVTLPADQQKFLKFAETHRTVLNQILRQSTTHLADGPFAVLVDHTRVLDFDVKRRYFRSELDRMDEGIRREELAVHVRRSHVFEDSFRELHRRTADEWKNRFYIVFEGEEGQDAGGLLREWYVIISREIFNPMYALFTTSPGDRVTYMINSSSHCNPNHLCYFKFVGRVIAKAIYDNKLLECYFTRSFYKHILGILVKHTDMESEDYSFYQGLVYLMEHHVSDLGYDLTFSAEVQEFGVTEVRDLIPNGRNIPVSEHNKMDYIRLVCQMKMTVAIRKQINAFLEGFYDIIPKRLISIFNEQELELLISGMPNVDIEDLRSNTEYHKYQPNSLQIQWFWRALRGFDQADRAKFLQFVTGTSKVPLQGFAALEGMNGVQKFQIHRDDRATDRLPSAHTCFNQLDLPVYETYDKLRTYLLKAIHECSEGFGFA